MVCRMVAWQGWVLPKVLAAFGVHVLGRTRGISPCALQRQGCTGWAQPGVPGVLGVPAPLTWPKFQGVEVM